MAPRPIGEIISSVTEVEEDVTKSFLEALKEIYTHPRDQINKHLVYISDAEIYKIREELFLRYHRYFKTSRDQHQY